MAVSSGDYLQRILDLHEEIGSQRYQIESLELELRLEREANARLTREASDLRRELRDFIFRRSEKGVDV